MIKWNIIVQVSSLIFNISSSVLVLGGVNMYIHVIRRFMIVDYTITSRRLTLNDYNGSEWIYEHNALVLNIWMTITVQNGYMNTMH